LKPWKKLDGKVTDSKVVGDTLISKLVLLLTKLLLNRLFGNGLVRPRPRGELVLVAEEAPKVALARLDFSTSRLSKVSAV
jgi:hypothetical protein